MGPSPTSWVAQQQARRQRLNTDGSVVSEDNHGDDDTEVVRAMKSILNKLTIERFGPLYQQLISCGICDMKHVEILMREVFEKATTQHHFIGMYAELCSQLHKWFVENQVCGDDGKCFKRILLNRCQLSFEETLKPQEDLGDLEPERRQEAEHMHKMRMLGNLRLVGALLEKGMLASRILVAVVDELLSGPTAASLECLSVFLTAVGPSFDRSDWAHHAHLEASFRKVKELVYHNRAVPSRVRFLLQDVLDLRASGWQNKKKAVPDRSGPTTLDAVHKQAQEELGERITPLARTFSSVGAAPVLHRAASALGDQAYKRADRGGAEREANRSAQAATLPTSASKKGDNTPSAPKEPFDSAKFHKELKGLLKELSESLDVSEGLERVKAGAVPLDCQVSELANLLMQISEEGRPSARQAGFALLAQLFVQGVWDKTALSKGLEAFMTESYDDLKVDIPALPRIFQEELVPVLGGVVKKGLLDAGLSERILATTSKGG